MNWLASMFGGGQQPTQQQQNPVSQPGAGGGGFNPLGMLGGVLSNPLVLMLAFGGFLFAAFTGKLDFSKIGETVQGFFGNIMSMFTGGDQKPTASNPSAPGGARSSQYETQLTSTLGVSTIAPDASKQLSYANAGDNSFLDPKQYEGKIQIPENLIKEAKQRGDSCVYAMVAVDANSQGGNNPIARGFHVFHDINTGKTELIPFVSGGDTIAVSSSELGNARSVESKNGAPLPGLVADQTSAGDGIHAKRTITTVDLNSGGDGFEFFLGYDDGTPGRDGIGAHQNLNNSKKGGKGVSRGCPVVQPSDVARMKSLISQYGLASGSTYYILDPNEVIKTNGNTQYASPNVPINADVLSTNIALASHDASAPVSPSNSPRPPASSPQVSA